MNTLFRAALIVLAACMSLTAQQTTSCPHVTITGPAGVTAPGETATYQVSVNLSENQKLQLEYVWSTTAGEIVRGQGTTSIEVRRELGRTMVATVEVRGLPEGCPNV